MAVLPTFPAVTLATRTLCIDEWRNRLLNDLSAVWEIANVMHDSTFGTV